MGYDEQDTDTMTIITKPSHKCCPAPIINIARKFTDVSIDSKSMCFPMGLLKDLQTHSLHIYCEVDYTPETFMILYNMQLRGTVLFWYVCDEPDNWWNSNVKKQERIDAIAALLS